MKRILLVAPFTLLPDEIGDNRFRYIAELLATKHEVTFVTSNFNHPEKKFRTHKEVYVKLPYRLVLLAEKGYQKNIGIARIISHRVFAKNLRSFLADADGKFDFVYAAFPPIEAAGICADFAKQQGIPFILDVQDVWPESILVYFNRLSGLAKWALKPLTAKANSVYAQADALVAVSQTYLNRAAQFNKKATTKLPLYIGTDLGAFDVNAQKRLSFSAAGDELIGIYVGTLSHSYDLRTVIRAAAKLKLKGIKLRILILGEGPFAKRLKDETQALNAPVEFIGFKPYAEMCGYLSRSHFALHSIVGASQSSLTNKFADYCAAGLPILNSSENLELKTLVGTNNLGINYPAEDIDALCNAMHLLYLNKENGQQMGANARAYAEKQLDRKVSYQALFNLFA
jgi:glycosyltransferase involved in cell wall biosynthesis